MKITTMMREYHSNMQTEVNGVWVPVRPLPFYTWRTYVGRIKKAWHVITGRAEAIYWE